VSTAVCRSILVVDDDDDIRDALSEVLRAAGHQVMTAANGREALDILRQGPDVCLVLLDLMMPVMDGYRFLELQAQDPQLAAVPVAIITAGTVDRGRATRVTLLRKPIKLPQLMTVIAQHC
jgi:CheY-like chemotaxis protein